MTNFSYSLGSALQYLGLALMVGGMLAIGAFCAPAIFKAFSRHEAGAVLTIIFTRYDIVLLIAFALSVIGEVLRVISNKPVMAHPVAYVRYGLFVVLGICLVISTQIINPKIQRMQQEGIHPEASAQGLEFLKIHKTSENLYKLEMLLAAGLILLTPCLPERQA